MALKQKASDEDARKAAVLLKQIDYQLMGLVSGEGSPFTLATADRLVRIQRTLRALRHEIEMERHFNTAQMAVPRPWRTGGGTELRVIHGDRRGVASAIF